MRSPFPLPGPFIAAAASLMLAGCRGPEADPRAEQRVAAEQRADRNKAEGEEQKWVDGMEAGVRIQALQKRVDELEAEVAVLKNTPERLDLDLLTQRVLRLEVAASSATVDPVTGSPVVQTTSPAKLTQPSPNQSSSTQTKPSRTPARSVRKPGSLELDLR